MLRVTPERDHLAGISTYPVTATLLGTTDGETPYGALQARWDLDGNGAWDAGFSTQKTQSATLHDLLPIGKSDRRMVHVQVKDGAGITTDAYRFIWAVPYDSPPKLSVTFAPAGATMVVATAVGTDADQGTTWDGSLEYRWDVEGDDIWDTPFGPTPTLTIPASLQTSLQVQVKDRLHALATWPSGLGQ
jgi:hypothetical protein